jgi:hypothetical protein
VDKRYLTAFILPKEWEVVGYRLKPYSIRKHLNLIAVESPYVTGQVPTAAETIQFLKFCASDCNSIIEIPKLTLFDYVAYARIRYYPQFHVHVIKCIVNYIKEYTIGPRYRIVKRDKTETIVSRNTIPDMLGLTAICMSKLGMSEDEVLNSPIGKLTWYAAATAALDGADVRMETDEEAAKDQIEELKRWEREQAEKLRLAMVNGKIPTRKIRIREE